MQSFWQRKIPICKANALQMRKFLDLLIVWIIKIVFYESKKPQRTTAANNK